MADSNDFVTTYLREIGVQTPVSLLRCVAEATNSPVALELDDWQTLQAEMQVCQRCALCESRQHVLLGAGNRDADVVFIGEAPNAAEDAIQEGFVGDVGLLFDAMLASLGLLREDIYQLNIVRCAPANHRDPKADEFETCQTWLDAELALLKPKVIVVLGRMAAQALLQTDQTMRELRKDWHVYHETAVRVLYHPAYLLRSPRQKSSAWQDFLLLNEYLSESLTVKS